MIHAERKKRSAALLILAALPACAALLAHERQRGSIGYIDKTGQVLITSRVLHEAGNFSGGFARVRLHENKVYKYGYLDREGKMAIPARFDWARHFSEVKAWVEAAEGRGYIDHSGRLVIKGEYRAGGDFSSGLVAVGTE